MDRMEKENNQPPLPWNTPFDPDEGFLIEEEFQKQLEESLASVQRGAKTTPVQEVAKQLGLKW